MSIGSDGLRHVTQADLDRQAYEALKAFKRYDRLYERLKYTKPDQMVAAISDAYTDLEEDCLKVASLVLKVYRAGGTVKIDGLEQPNG